MSERCLVRYTTTELVSGDRMSQEEFHGIYETMPDNFRAELLNGTVFVSVPTSKPHATGQNDLSTIFGYYRAMTDGIESFDNATLKLSKKDEVQPDLGLRILPAYGGQTKDTYDGYISGAPELVAEIAFSSRAIDLHLKRARYKKFGVIEYIVVCLKPKEIYWFDLHQGLSFRKKPDENGILKSHVFPGLWIDGNALLKKELKKSLEILQQGLGSPEHAEFVAKLNSSVK